MRALKAHQERMREFALSRNRRAGLFTAPGTGKTIVALRCAVPPIICFGRRDDFLTWRLELEAEASPWSAYFVENPSQLDDIPLDAEFVMLTWDMVRVPGVVQWIRSFGFCTVIGDELHQIKRMKAKRTKKVHEAIRDIPNRLGLTGTPLTNDACEDVFSLGLFVDGGRTFGDNWWKFMKRYFIAVPGAGHHPKRESFVRIQHELSKFAIYMHEDDVLKLPPIRHYTKSVKLSGMQRRFYNQVLNNWDLTRADGSTFEMRYTLQRLQKLQQIADGWYYDPDNGRITWLRSTKFELLETLLKDDFADKPKIVIWCAYTPEIVRIGRIAESLGIGSVKLFGSSRVANERSRIRFRDDPNVRLFIGQVDKGVGMNELIVADTAIYFSNSQRVVSREQSLRRIRRIGSERHRAITYVDLVSEGTVDELRLAALTEKMDLADWLLKKSKHEGITAFLSHRLAS